VSNLFKLVLSMSLSGSAIILVLLFSRPLFKERFSRAWQYYVWFIVLLRLVIPYSPEFGLINGLFQQAPAQSLPPVPETRAPYTQAGEPVQAGNAQAGGGSVTPAPAENRSEPDKLPDVWEIAGLLWLTGAILLLAFKAAQYKRFVREVRSDAREVTKGRLASLLSQTAAELKIKGSLPLFESAQIKSPMLMGILRPAVILPETAAGMDDVSLSYVFRHELTHYKRLDLSYKWAAELILCVHWFNPLVHLMNRGLSGLCELSCDEAVAKKLDAAAKKEYGGTLLMAVSENAGLKRGVFSMTLCEDKKSLKERLSAILKAGRKSKKTILLSVIAAAALCGAALCLGAFSSDGNAETTAPAQAEDGRPYLTWEAVKELAGGSLGYMEVRDTYYFESIGSGLYIVRFPIGGSEDFSLIASAAGPDAEPTAVGLNCKSADLSLDLNAENLGIMMDLFGGGSLPDADEPLPYGEDERRQDEQAVRELADAFGKALQKVSLSAPDSVISADIEKIYGGFVTPELLQKWQADPKSAPGRLVSSPWPDRIDILSVEWGSAAEYTVYGEIIEVTSVELASGGAAAKKPVTLSVQKVNDRFLIGGVALGEYAQRGPVVYENTRYGFSFYLPESWKGYSIVEEQWQSAVAGEAGAKPAETGPQLLIRHPGWTKDDPRQDIPIMVFTAEQWDAVENGNLIVSAAPIGPRKLGGNSEYVFALPPRYNFAFPTGYEEVEEILNGNPLWAG